VILVIVGMKFFDNEIDVPDSLSARFIVDLVRCTAQISSFWWRSLVVIILMFFGGVGGCQIYS